MLPGVWRGVPQRGVSLRIALAAIIVGLVLAHFAVLALSSGLDVDTQGVLAPLDLFQERSAGTWFNAFLLAAVALAALALAAATPRLRRGWALLAGLVALASIDEVAGIHESVVHVLRSAADLPGFLLYASWVVPAVALVGAFVVWQWRFFRALPGWLGRRFALAAGVYVVAAVGLEMLESSIFAARGGQDSDWTGVLQVLVGIEEGLEMGAAAAMLVLLLRHLADVAPEWRIAVTATGGPDRGTEHVSVTGSRRPGATAPAPDERERRGAALRERRIRPVS
jgi:hypothetical protein